MTAEIGFIGRILGALFGIFQKRHHAERWVGRWEACALVGRNLAGPMSGAGPADVSLAPWWKFSSKLMFKCCDCDESGRPTRHQEGYIQVEPGDPNSATRFGRYLDSAEVYEQRLKMLDDDAILIIPVPDRSTLGDVYAKHGWRKKL